MTEPDQSRRARRGRQPDLLCQRAEPGISVLRLNRPERLNALTDDMVTELTHTLDTLAADPELRVLILTGEGRGFCAGFDLTLAAEAPLTKAMGEAAAWTARQEAFASIVTKLRALRAPVIAAVNGPANGAGLGMSLACEIRLASPDAAFNAAFVKVGMSSCDIGVSWLLPRCVGMSRAFEIMLTGRMVGAEEAERIGLVSAVVDDRSAAGAGARDGALHRSEQHLWRVDDQARRLGQHGGAEPAGGDRAGEPHADPGAHHGRAQAQRRGAGQPAPARNWQTYGDVGRSARRRA